MLEYEQNPNRIRLSRYPAGFELEELEADDAPAALHLVTPAGTGSLPQASALSYNPVKLAGKRSLWREFVTRVDLEQPETVLTFAAQYGPLLELEPMVFDDGRWVMAEPLTAWREHHRRLMHIAALYDAARFGNRGDPFDPVRFKKTDWLERHMHKTQSGQWYFSESGDANQPTYSASPLNQGLSETPTGKGGLTAAEAPLRIVQQLLNTQLERLLSPRLLFEDGRPSKRQDAPPLRDLGLYLNTVTLAGYLYLTCALEVSRRLGMRKCALESCGLLYVFTDPRDEYCCNGHKQKAWRARKKAALEQG